MGPDHIKQALPHWAALKSTAQVLRYLVEHPQSAEALSKGFSAAADLLDQAAAFFTRDLGIPALGDPLDHTLEMATKSLLDKLSTGEKLNKDSKLDFLRSIGCTVREVDDLGFLVAPPGGTITDEDIEQARQAAKKILANRGHNTGPVPPRLGPWRPYRPGDIVGPIVD